MLFFYAENGQRYICIAHVAEGVDFIFMQPHPGPALTYVFTSTWQLKQETLFWQNGKNVKRKFNNYGGF